MNDNIWIAYYLLYINPVANGCYNIDQAFSHWIKTGRHNNNVIFDWEFYLNYNCIPNITTLEKALEHFLKVGLAKSYKTTNLSTQTEIIATYFNWEFYVSNYCLNSITSRKSAINHYNKKGKKMAWIYNEYMENMTVKSLQSLPCGSDIISKEIVDDNVIVLNYNDSSKIKNVEHALGELYRCSYSRLLKILLLIKIELIRISSDLQFSISTKQQQVIESYILEIQDLIENTIYQDNRLFQTVDNSHQKICVVSSESGVTVDDRSDYKFGQSLDFEITITATELFKSLTSEQLEEFNQKWSLERTNQLEHSILMEGIKNDLVEYKKYLDGVESSLKHKNELLLEIFNNQKNLLVNGNLNSVNSVDLIEMMTKNFEIVTKRHNQLIEFLETNPDMLCNSSYSNLDEITKKSFDYMMTDLNNLHLNCQSSLAGNSVNSLDNLEEAINLYKKVNLTTSQTITENLNTVEATQKQLNDLFMDYTNTNLDYNLINTRTESLKNLYDQLTLHYQQQSDLSEFNTTISAIRNIFNIMNLDAINQVILNNQLAAISRTRNITELSNDVDNSLILVATQKELVDKFTDLIENISHQSSLSLFNTIFKKNYFEINCKIKQTGKTMKCHHETRWGKHIIRLPYDIYLDISAHNPLIWGLSKPIYIKAKNVMYKKCQVYCNSRLQYEVKVDTMHLNIHKNSILFDNFENVKQSLCYIENAIDIVIGNFKNVFNATLKL